MTQPLTPALEDYLEVIYQLSKENGTARISDIAQRMDIAKPSVTQAITTLRREGMVYQDRYGPVLLTPKGEKRASEVWYRHRVIRRYLEEALQVSPVKADQDACMMEHSISTETFTQIEKWLQEKTGANTPPAPKAQITLAELLPGQKARIVKIAGKDTPIRQRLMEMGLVSGVELEMERFAPLGDPIEINLQGQHLSLRQAEAAMLLVELIS
ncbi:MAG: metal-dependent transcriptional regulator [Methanocorpusculum sp.]|nr:metal-dependent transcriptional regulator [Methanocorpusculum sp.]